MSAFPTSSALELMLAFQMDLPLRQVTSEGASLADTVFQLLRWAEAHGRVDELVAGACEENPGNPQLAEVAAELGQGAGGPETTGPAGGSGNTVAATAAAPRAAEPILSLQERLSLFRALGALPVAQLEALLFAVKPPPGVVPPSSTPGTQRIASLLEWVEGPRGPGLAQVQQLLEAVLDASAAPLFAPPFYVLRLTVENIRCFRGCQTLDLSLTGDRPARWTVILGNNGTGKTTLLRCLAALDAGMDPLFLREQHLLERNSSAPDSGSAPRIGATLHFGARLAECDGSRIRECEIARGTGRDEVAKPFLHERLACFAYGASRQMGSSGLGPYEAPQRWASLFQDNVALVNAEEWLLQTDYAARQSGAAGASAGNRLNQVKTLLVDLLPEVEDLHIVPPDEFGRGAGVRFLTQDGWISVWGLSLGYRTVIAWMVDLARRLVEWYPESARPLDEPALVLVDEMDLHLHPAWQRNLISFLQKWFVNTQFVVTAHSPLIVQAAEDARIVLLARDEAGAVKIINDAPSVRGYRVDQILTSDLFQLPSSRSQRVDEALEQRRKILGKAALTETDRADLRRLDEQIGALPIGERPEDREAMEVIRRAADALKGVKLRIGYGSRENPHPCCAPAGKISGQRMRSPTMEDRLDISPATGDSSTNPGSTVTRP